MRKKNLRLKRLMYWGSTALPHGSSSIDYIARKTSKLVIEGEKVDIPCIHALRLFGMILTITRISRKF